VKREGGTKEKRRTVMPDNQTKDNSLKRQQIWKEMPSLSSSASEVESYGYGSE